MTKFYQSTLKLVVIIFITTSFIIAEGKKTNNPSLRGAPSYSKFNINNVSSWFSNYGISDNDPNGGSSGFRFPKISRNTSVFQSGLIWGGKIDGQTRIGGTTYRSGLLPGRILPNGTREDETLPHVRIYRVRRDYKTANLFEEANDENKSIQEIYSQYELDWNEWPAVYGAPFEDIDNNGSYNPSVDIPGYIGADQTLWFVSNDLDTNTTLQLYGSNPMGIELQTTIWGYNTNNEFGDMLFRKYKVINKSTKNFDEMFLSMWSDPDLGYARDDYVGCDTNLDLSFSYNAFQYDQTYGNNPPTIGFQLLQGPKVIGNAGDVAIFDGKFYPGYKNLPMNTFYFFINGNPEYGDPNFDDYSNGTLKFYNLIKGRKTNGDPYVNPTNNTNTVYPLSGDPINSTGWVDGILHSADDRRMGLSCGPFTLANGDTQEVIFVEMAEQGLIVPKSNLLNINGLKSKAASTHGLIKSGAAVIIKSEKLVQTSSIVKLATSHLFSQKNVSILSRKWEIASQPSNDKLFTVNSDTSSFIPSKDGIYKIAHTIYTNNGDSASSFVEINVTSNRAPIASFNIDKILITWGDSLIVDASLSIDPDGDPLSFSWSGGPFANISTSNFGSQAIIFPLSTGIIPIILQVNDGTFFSFDTVFVKVDPLKNNITTNFEFHNDGWSRSIPFFKGDTLLYPVYEKIGNQDSEILKIYNITNSGIQYERQIKIPGIQYVSAFIDDLLFVRIGDNSSGFYGPGSISIYRVGTNWQLTKILDEYKPGSGSISGFSFKDGVFYLTDLFEDLYKIDFLSDPSNPLILGHVPYKNNLSQSGFGIYKNFVMVRVRDNSNNEDVIEVRNRSDLSLVNKIDLSQFYSFNNYTFSNDNLFVSHRDSTVIAYSFDNLWNPVKEYEFIISPPNSWDIWNYNKQFRVSSISSKKIIGIENFGGNTFFDIRDINNPLKIGSIHANIIYNINVTNNNFYLSPPYPGFPFYSINFQNYIPPKPMKGWQSNLTISDASGVRAGNTLTFGQDNNASDGLDAGLGEIEQPPAPPSGTFDAVLILPDNTTRVLKDFRNSDSTKIKWQIKFQPGSSGYPVTLSWDASKLPQGSFKLKDMLGGVVVNQSMKTSNTVQISNAGITGLIIEYSQEVCSDVAVNNGWNLLSIPVSPQDKSKDTIFPNSTSNAFYFENGYKVADSLDLGVGYWLKFGNRETINICGEVGNGKLKVISGWNMVGVFENTVVVNKITSVPSGIITSNFFEFDNGYKPADTLNPGKGYWVKVSQAGELNYGSTTRTIAKTINKLEIGKDWNTISIVDKEGSSSVLYSTTESINLSSFDLPPVPPSGIKDVRFGSSRLVENLNNSESIKLQSLSYPIVITISGMDVRIKDKVGGSLLNKIVRDGEKVVISNPSINEIELESIEIPVSYQLSQNYPNPFNPSTKIKYGLPEKTNVRLEIYNVLGEKVVTLVNQEMDMGYHEVEFNASKLSSGVYIYRIHTDSFTDVKKMLILK